MSPRSLVRPLLRAAVLAGALAASVAQADLFVVVHASNPVRSMTQKEALDLFMGRSRAFADGAFAIAFDLPRDSTHRAAFYQHLTGMNLAQVNSYWSRLMFSGKTLPPQPLPGEAAMLDVVRRNPSAIGYLPREPADKGVHVVLVLKETP